MYVYIPTRFMYSISFYFILDLLEKVLLIWNDLEIIIIIIFFFSSLK